ncbi:multidrug effflux MFS transporter [Microbacterium capsulatum]|uniref:Multidrug effflux MFS transporter n=1 Tax=Microbacterium capsulatum TaxID=3041921 RepID=A0ABU0XKA6_9MICO|nr:multidrug effflux MFS transporter [Microbacterium sp. ASV81]MDQ4215541.1 multidrug effflux MFS transporter [Microbacterium sp. ASV81]
MTTRTAPPAGTRRSLLPALGALSAFGPISIDGYLPSMPALAADLHTSDALAQFTMSACMIGMAVGTLLWGSISDRYGRRRPLMWGVAGFALTAVLCALAPSIEALIAVRFVQGLCGAAGIVIARAVVHDLFTGADAVAGFSSLAAIAGAAPVLAPLMGGALLTFTDWRGVFVALAVIGVLLLVTAMLFVPETHPREERTTGGMANDFRGFGAALGNRGFMISAVTLGIASVSLFSYLQMSSFVLQSEYGVSAQGYALIFASNAVGIVLAARLNRRLSRRMTGARIGAWSLSIGTVATAAILLSALLHSALPWLLVPLFLAVAVQGVNNPAFTALALGEITRGAGSASAVLGTLSMLLGALIPPLVSSAGVSAPVMGASMCAAFACALLVRTGTSLARRRSGS